MKTLRIILIYIVIASFLIVGIQFINNVPDLEKSKDIVDINGSIKLSYVGDLILLKDQVIYSKNNDSYDFNYMFQYAKKYFDDSDYTIGVFEGPSTDNYEYSTSNYGDGLKLALNFPKSFIKAVKNSGIDFVTTANNHMLDVGYEAAMETLDNLEESGLEYTGTYRNQEEYEKTKIIEIDGVKIAVLSYTYGSNKTNKSYFFEEKPYFSKLIVPKNNEYFEKTKSIVLNDIQRAKDANVDIIMVTAHMGTQFKHTTNSMQNLWNKIFAENGVDIVLGDHAHATQPVEWLNETLIVNCPGNFANSYIKNDGDATSIVNIYIDKITKKVVTSSVIPMYTFEVSKNKFAALPIYDIFTDDNIKKQLNNLELIRAEEVLSIVTKSMIGKKMVLDNLQKEFYVNGNKDVTINDSIADSKFFMTLQDSESITFIGDSITEGTKNEYNPWFNPIVKKLDKKKIYNVSKGGLTIKALYNTKMEQLKNIKSDVVVIGIGCNDIRYRSKSSALTSKEYIDYMNKVISVIKENNKDTKFFVLAPWPSLDYDRLSKVNLNNKNKLYSEYILALEKEYANSEEVIFINQYKYLKDFFTKNNAYQYLTDQIHPNKDNGIILYSKSVLESY